MATADELLRAFAQWSAEVRRRDAAASRSRERWLAQQAAEAATFRGTLVDLAEAGSAVVVATPSHRFSGALVSVGADLCVVEEPGRVNVIDLSGVVGVSPLGAPGRGGWAGAATGDRAAALEVTFDEALRLMAGELAPVRLALRGGDTVDGDLIAVGHDVVTLRRPAQPPQVNYLAAPAIEAFIPR